jgi:hypothetical protein
MSKYAQLCNDYERASDRRNACVEEFRAFAQGICEGLAASLGAPPAAVTLNDEHFDVMGDNRSCSVQIDVVLPAAVLSTQLKIKRVDRRYVLQVELGNHHYTFKAMDALDSEERERAYNVIFESLRQGLPGHCETRR